MTRSLDARSRPKSHFETRFAHYFENQFERENKDLTKLSSTRQTYQKHVNPSTQNDIPVKLMPTEPVDLLAASRLQ